MNDRLDAGKVRKVAADLVAAGHKVTLDYCVATEAAAVVIRRQSKTLRNWRYNCMGPRWEKLPDGSVWYRIADLIEWKQKMQVGTTRDAAVLDKAGEGTGNCSA